MGTARLSEALIWYLLLWSAMLTDVSILPNSGPQWSLSTPCWMSLTQTGLGWGVFEVTSPQSPRESLPLHTCAPQTSPTAHLSLGQKSPCIGHPLLQTFGLFGGLQPFLGSLLSTHESAQHLSSWPHGGGILQPYSGMVMFWHVTGRWMGLSVLLETKGSSSPLWRPPGKQQSSCTVNCCPWNIIQVKGHLNDQKEETTSEPFSIRQANNSFMSGTNCPSILKTTYQV